MCTRQKRTAERIACSGVPSRITSVLPAPLHDKAETFKRDQSMPPVLYLARRMCFLCQDDMCIILSAQKTVCTAGR